MSSIDNFHQAQIYHIAPDATQTDTDKLKGVLGREKKKKALPALREETL